MRAFSLAFALALALGVSGAALAQGVYESVPLKSKEPDVLIKTSKELRAYFAQRSAIYASTDVTALVETVGNALAPSATDDYIEYRFFVLRDPSPNAFALPNGDIYIHAGMLARLEDDAQLAAVLAHEANHVAGHHAVVDYRAANKKIIAGMVLSGVLGGAGSAMSAGLVASMYGFSRSVEEEADDRAVTILAASPYDAHALPEIYDILAADYEGLRPRLPTAWSTHPQLEARAERTREQVASLPVGERNAAGFDTAVMPLRLEAIRDYIQDDYPQTAIALAEDLGARYPSEPAIAALRGDAWVALGAAPRFDSEDLRNAEKRRNLRRRVTKTRQERAAAALAEETGPVTLAANLDAATEAYDEALGLAADYAPALRGRAQVAEARGDDRAAARAYLDYLERAPDAADRVVVLQRLGAIRDRLQSEGTSP
jgi:predicted Zn-dependent protease